MPTPRAGVAAIAAFGCLYMIGGEGNPAHPQGMFAQTEAYDPRTNTWQSLTPMATPTHGLNRAVFLNGRIHVPAGRSPSAATPAPRCIRSTSRSGAATSRGEPREPSIR
jgi:hypothetical protein